MAITSKPSTDPEDADKGPMNSEELAFHPSPGPMLGVEVELQVVDRETGDLAPGAPQILKSCKEESIEGVTAEMMQSMLEVKTGACGNPDQMRTQLHTRLKRVRNIVRSLGYELVAAGTHPFNRTNMGAVFPTERYERIADRLGRLVSQRVMFGLHVHVGMPSGDMAINAINLLTRYTPHLVALSASSPFWQGMDTGLASSRTTLRRLHPHAGLPLHFGSWKDFRSYCKVMADTKTIGSYKDIHWDIRPRPDLGTIEFRMCDMPMTFTETVRIVTLIYCMTLSGMQLLEERPRTKRADVRHHWIAVENKWLATRHGLRATYVRTPTGKRRPLRLDLEDVIERLMPIANGCGAAQYLESFKPLEKLEIGSDRQRRRFRDTGDWKLLVGDMADNFKKDLEGDKPVTRT